MARKKKTQKTQLPTIAPPNPRENLAVKENGAHKFLRAIEAWREWVIALALIVVGFLAYQPAWHGGFIWDDQAHITRADLRNSDGLYRIWFEVGATQQYYPFLHSVFWVEHQLWGDHTFGYHLVNISLHLLASLLLVRFLKRLAIPGAWLAGAIFALHPVQVESVAWITELKNTLSAVFYLSAALAYLRFDLTHKRRWYAVAFVLFFLGLLSKTVVATLPGALLVVFWWQRGRLSWRRDVLPLIPFFLMGAVAGIFTAWVERKLIGADGIEFQISFVQRCLISGRVVWFYLGKLAWPAELIFMYPRWMIDPQVWWQYLFPLTAIFLLGYLWALRRRTRAPLAAVLIFGGTLFPVLGFFNVFPFVYSFVADHFQYLACLGVITLFSAGVALFLKRAEGWKRLAGQFGCVVVLAGLTILTWQQSRMYSDIDTLYLTTIKLNPDCWMANNNLGLLMADRGKMDEAIAYFRKALQIKPDYVHAHNNLGVRLAERGQYEEAISHYRQAIDRWPHYIEAHNNLGTALVATQKIDEAITHYEEALKMKADFAEGHFNLAEALRIRGDTNKAIEHDQEALRLNPNFAAAENGLGLAYAVRGQKDDAITHYRNALKINPDLAEAHNNLGSAMLERKQYSVAMDHFRKVLEAKPSDLVARNNLANAHSDLGQWNDAIAEFQKALQYHPESIEVWYNLGNSLSKSRKPNEGMPYLQKALELAKARNNAAMVEFIRNRMNEAGR